MLAFLLLSLHNARERALVTLQTREVYLSFVKINAITESQSDFDEEVLCLRTCCCQDLRTKTNISENPFKIEPRHRFSRKIIRRSIIFGHCMSETRKCTARFVNHTPTASIFSKSMRRARIRILDCSDVKKPGAWGSLLLKGPKKKCELPPSIFIIRDVLSKLAMA